MGAEYARFLGFGLVLVLLIAIPTAIGYFLDRLLGTIPLFLLIGLGLGFAAGMYRVYAYVKQLGGR